MKLYTVHGGGLYAGGLYLVAAKSPDDAIELARQWIKDDSEHNPICVSSATEVGTCRGKARVVDSFQYIE